MTRNTSTQQLLDRYRGVLLDAYGVLVSLDGALPGAVEFIAELNRRDQPYWLVSNTAARLPDSAAARYRGFGLEIPAERILTSGMLLKPHFAAAGLCGKRTLVLGPEDSRHYVEQAGGVPVAVGEAFEVMVLADQAGFPLLETVDWLLSALFERLDAGEAIPLLLPNPDLVYPKALGFGITSGSVAVMIEAALRQRYPERPDLAFTRLGKPHAAIFEMAVSRAQTRDLVMVGDQLETDIRGANDFGMDSALLLGGVAGLQPRFAAGQPQPTWLLETLWP